MSDGLIDHVDGVSIQYSKDKAGTRISFLPTSTTTTTAKKKKSPKKDATITSLDSSFPSDFIYIDDFKDDFAVAKERNLLKKRKLAEKRKKRKLEEATETNVEDKEEDEADSQGDEEKVMEDEWKGENEDSEIDEAQSEDSNEDFSEDDDEENVDDSIAEDSDKSISDSDADEEALSYKAEDLEPSPPVQEKLLSETLSTWGEIKLPEIIVQGLLNQGFTSPTEIQSKVLPVALRGTANIVGCAETGSGKTLAYGLPILHSIATKPPSKVDLGLLALILTPTRELAMQVVDHLKKVGKGLGNGKGVHVVSVVGGIAIQKQRRLLGTKPDVVVATPGRLWEVMDENEELCQRFRLIKYLVLDEADRMLESGHFKDLDMIFERINPKKEAIKQKRQTFVFSATMLNTASLKTKLQKDKVTPGTQNLKTLLAKLNLSKPPTIISTTSPSTSTPTATKLPSTLHESRIDCLTTDKELYLYYLLSRHPAKTIIFVNSIDCIRRLLPILKMLKVNAIGLHAELEMKARMKALEKFKSEKDFVLVTSDVAARGLDIPEVEQVVHYQLPRSADLYVHRAGRTARANKEGVSILLCSPNEVTLYKRICKVLNKESGVGEFPVSMSYLAPLRSRVDLARKIEQKEHSISKSQYESNWTTKMSKEAELDDFDAQSSFEFGKKPKRSATDEEQQNTGISKAVLKRLRTEIAKMKAELDGMMDEKVLPLGINRKYLTGAVNMDDVKTLLTMNGTKSIFPADAPTSATNVLKNQKRKRR
ncbi:hypothetical protein HK098_002477 [Nowakowskiella sp. JEL0407]|nr:hypothetical protein HK098_002477 [Nowakowskiella sp. JEL0407]